MTQTILTPLESAPLLTGLVILGVVIVVLLLTRKGKETVTGICAAALDQTVRKKTMLDSILS